MADGRDRAEWARASAVMMVLANCSRDPKKRRRPFTCNDFDPYATKSSARGLSVAEARLFFKGMPKGKFGTRKRPSADAAKVPQSKGAGQ